MSAPRALRSLVFAALRLPGVNQAGKALLRRGIPVPPHRLPFVFPAAGTLPIALPGGRTFLMQSDGSDTIASRAYFGGAAAFEPETVAVFLEAASRATCFLDVGANTGIYSLMAAAVGASREIHAFEPLPALCARLKDNARLNGFTAIRANATAVGAADGEIEVHIPRGIALPTGGSTLPGRYQAGRGRGVTSFRRPLRRLDTYVREQELTRVDLIKIDTEATEHLVLEGASRTLDEHQPLVICEVVDRQACAQVQRVLSRHPAYDLFHITAGGLERRRELQVDPTLRWMNYLFVPQSRAAELEPLAAALQRGGQAGGSVGSRGGTSE